MRLLYLSLFWLLGIALSPTLNLPWLLILSPIPLILLFLIKRSQTGLLLSFFILAFLGGIARYQPAQDRTEIEVFQGKEIEVVGVVATEPVPVEKGQMFIIDVDLAGGRRARGRVLVLLPSLPEYKCGDRLWLKGKLEPTKGLSGAMFYPKFKLISRAENHPLLRELSSLRERLSSSLKQTMPEPQGALARALLLGFRGDIPKELKTAFSQTGTAHILAISGLHIGILLGMLLGFGVWAFGRKNAYYLLPAFLGIWFYALISGFRPPTVRASIMGSLFLCAEYLGRPKAGLTALSLAAVIMTAVNPQILQDISFQMSFLAMGGLIIFSPPLRRLASKLPLPGYLIDALSYSVGALVGVFPLIAYYFQILSLVSVPATLLALPFLPPIIFLSAASSFAGLLNPILASPFSWLDWLLLSYLIELVESFSSLPGAFLKLLPFPPSWLWLYYGVMFLPPILPPQITKNITVKMIAGLARGGKAFLRLFSSSRLSWCLLGAALLIWASYLSLPPKELGVTFFDVGNGDAILVQKGKTQIIIDGGPDPVKFNLELSKKLPFYDRRIELAVLTHADADHLRGLLGALEHYHIKQVLESGWQTDTLLYQKWCEKLKEKKVPVVYARAGQKIELAPDIKLEVLHPQEGWLIGTEEDQDNNGVILRLDYDRISFLFTGDLRVEGERELILRRAHLKAVVLKVAHHGSATSSSEEFLRVVQPQIAVISSSGKGGLPNIEAIERIRGMVGERLYLTYEHGTIELITDGQRLWLRTGR